MKQLFIIFVAVALTAAAVNGQAPKSIKYQTVVRDASGEPLTNQHVNITLKILQGSATGNVVCSETFYPTTNEFGLVNLVIGSVNPSAFNAIDWSDGPYFTMIELNGNELGTSELLSVPYALFSERSSNSYWESIGTSIFYNEGKVGIGTSNPLTKLHILADDPDISLDLPSSSTSNLAEIKFRLDGTIKSRIYWSKETERLYFKNEGFDPIQIYQGKLGIGITPSSALSVNGYTTIENPEGSTKVKMIAGNSTFDNWITSYDENGNRLWVLNMADRSSNNRFGLYCDATDTYVFNIRTDGNVGIKCAGSSTYALSVNGSIRSKEVRVETGWADFVFDEDYNLLSIEDLKQYIKKNKHLPDIPSANEVEQNGISLGEMDSKLLRKIEELTLYIIQQNKQIEDLQKENVEIKHALNL